VGTTLSDVAGGADRHEDVVESGSVGWREIGVRTVTLLDHSALIARLLARLTVSQHRDDAQHNQYGVDSSQSLGSQPEC